MFTVQCKTRGNYISKAHMTAGNCINNVQRQLCAVLYEYSLLYYMDHKTTAHSFIYCDVTIWYTLVQRYQNTAIED